MSDRYPNAPVMAQEEEGFFLVPLVFTVANSATERARELERLRTDTSSGSRIAVIGSGVATGSAQLISPGDLANDSAVYSSLMGSHPQIKLLFQARDHLDQAALQPVETDQGLMAQEEAESRLQTQFRSAQARRDDAREDLALFVEELSEKVVRELDFNLTAEKEKKSQLLESLVQARDCNRRRAELLTRLTLIRASVPDGIPTHQLTQLVQDYGMSLTLLSEARDEVAACESASPLGRGPEWASTIAQDLLDPSAAQAGSLVEHLEKLHQVARQVQADMDAVAGPPLEETHLEEMAQQLAGQPAVGLEALDKTESPSGALADQASREKLLRQTLDQQMMLMTIAMAIGMLATAAGVVLLLGDHTQFGLVCLILGPLASIGWTFSIMAHRRAVKVEVNALVRHRIVELAKQTTGGQAPSDQGLGHSKLPAVAERVRAIQAGRKATAQKRLQVRSDHATWTKQFLESPEILRKRLPSPPDPFVPSMVEEWIRQAREISDALACEAIRRERLVALETAKVKLDGALAEFSVRRRGLAALVGPDADALSSTELEEKAKSLLADCTQVLTLEAALERAVEIPEAPLVERLAAIEARLTSLEEQKQVSSSGFDAAELNPSSLASRDQVRHQEIVDSLRQAEQRMACLRGVLDELRVSCQARIDAREFLIREILDFTSAHVRRVQQLFDDLAGRFWRVLDSGSTGDDPCPRLTQELELSEGVPEHLRSSLELLRSSVLAMQGPAPVRLIFPEPLADADNPTYLAWLSALRECPSSAGVAGITILTCQSWRLDALSGIARDLFQHIVVHTLNDRPAGSR